MYTLQCAASVLAVSITTVRRWIEQADIKKVIIRTDRARVYITHADVVTLAEKNFRKLKKLDKMTNRDSNSIEQDLYTIAEVATFIGVSINTVERWLIADEIEKKLIFTDKWRVHISYHDMLGLAIQHKNTGKREETIIGGQEAITSLKAATGRDKDLYTKKEVSQLLNVSRRNLDRWIQEFNINKQYIYTDKNRTYIHRSDVLMLADRYQETYKMGNQGRRKAPTDGSRLRLTAVEVIRERESAGSRRGRGGLGSGVGALRRP